MCPYDQATKLVINASKDSYDNQATAIATCQKNVLAADSVSGADFDESMKETLVSIDARRKARKQKGKRREATDSDSDSSPLAESDSDSSPLSESEPLHTTIPYTTFTQLSAPTKFHQDFRGQGHKARRPGIRASATVRNCGS